MSGEFAGSRFSVDDIKHPDLRAWFKAKISDAEAAAFKRGLEEAARIADADPECPGDMPDEARAAALRDPELWSRATVRATKKSISRSIRARAKDAPPS